MGVKLGVKIGKKRRKTIPSLPFFWLILELLHLSA